jgi:class 3 adenylate cyclase
VAATGRLVVTLAADAAGYSSVIGGDEEGALERLEAHCRQFIYPTIAEHFGRIAKATGDRLLVEFATPIEAVQCAVEMQRGMIGRDASRAPGRRLAFRIGIHAGEAATTAADLVSRAVAALPVDKLATLIEPGTEVYADGANTAVRLAALAEPAGICVSGTIWEAVRELLPCTFEDIGEQNLDSRAGPVRCYAMSPDALASRRRHVWLWRATVAASVSAMVGIWAVVLWAWLGANPSKAPVAVGSPMSGAARVAAKDEQAPLAPQPPVLSNVAAEKDIQAPSTLRPPAANSAAVDGRPQAPPARPTLSEIGAAVIKGREAPSALQTTPDTGIAVIRGILQAPSALHISPDNGATVVRGK